MRCLTAFLFVLLAFGVADTVVAAEPPDRKPLPVAEVAERIHSSEPLLIAELAAMGDRLFPAFHEILENPKKYRKKSAEAVFYVLSNMKGDRSQFLDHAIASLGDDDDLTRKFVVYFIESAGTEKEAGPLTLLLLDESSGIRLATARALAKIGGKREVATFDLIIKNATRYEYDGKLILSNFDIEDFEKCRDELKARLKKQDEEKAKKAPPSKKDDKK